MPLRGTLTHENGLPFWSDRIRATAAGQGRFVFGAVARNEPGPDLARTSTCRPVTRGARRANCFDVPRSPRRPAPEESTAMEIIYDRCAGLDVHKKTVVACVRRVGPDGRVAPRGPHLRHHDRRPAGPGRLARRPQGVTPRRHGVDRRLLEAGLPPPGGPLRGDAGQRPAHQAGPGPQDRRQGRRVDRPAAAARPARGPASSRRRRSASCAT